MVGDRGLDYRLRMLFAGIPDEKLVHVMKMEDAIKQVDIVPDMNYYVLYGADPGSFAVGNKQAKALAAMLREKTAAEKQAPAPEAEAPVQAEAAPAQAEAAPEEAPEEPKNGEEAES